MSPPYSRDMACFEGEIPRGNSAFTEDQGLESRNRILSGRQAIRSEGER